MKTEEKAQHTPGPWKAREYKNDNGGIWIDCDSWVNRRTASLRGGTLATAHAEGCGEGTVEANARLISAAPELLKALEGAHAMLRLMGVNLEAHEEGRRIIAAIAKATNR